MQFVDLPETLAARPCPAYDYRSSFVPFLAGAEVVDTGLTGAVHLAHLAAFWAVVASAGWAWLGFELTRALGRPGRSLAITAALVVVGSDVAFSAYFGSLYAEAMVLALLPAVGAAVVRLCRAERLEVPVAVVAGAVVVAITTSKPSLALTAALVVAVVAVARRGRGPARVLGPVALATVALTLFSLVGIADPTFSEWNTYNLAFTVVAPESGDPRAALRDMGLDPQEAEAMQRFVGVPFSKEVTDAKDDPAMQAFEARGKGPVLQALLLRPRVWVRMVDEGAGTLDDLHLDYLANHRRGPGDPEGPLLSTAPRPANLVLAPISWTGWALPLLWLAPLAWFGRRLRRGRADPVAALVVVAVGFAATQTVLALGDGYYELAKHLTVAGHTTALAATGLLVAGLLTLGGRAVSAVGARRTGSGNS